MNRALLASLFSFGLLSGSPVLAAEETYLLKVYQSKKGDKSDVEKTNQGTNKIIVNVNGTNNNQEVQTGDKEIYTEEILEKKEGDRNATKLTRKYTIAEKTEKGKTIKTVYSGETVLIEKKGKEFEFSIDGKKLTKDEAPELFKKFNKSDDEPTDQEMLPAEAVKVGGTWKVPVEKSEKMFKTLGVDEMKIDVKKSSISGKLLKAYKKDGAQFGVLELTISVFILEIDLGGQFAPTKAGSKIVITGTIDTCIDGTINREEAKKVVSIAMTAELPNGGSVTIDGESKGVDKKNATKQ